MAITCIKGIQSTLLITILNGMTLMLAASTRPHIIVIVADDLGWNDVSFHGSDQIPTPNIDILAYSGIILNNYYVSPICTPTRGALLSGRHPIHTGLQESVIVGTQPYGLPLNVTIMPQWLKKLGYRTHMVGKWHLGFFKKEYTPLQRGFETHLGYYQGCGDYYDHSYEADEEQFGFDFWNDTTIDYTKIGQYSTKVFTDRAVDIIQSHDAKEPLFLYLPYQAVHSGNLPSGNPLQAPTSYINRHPNIKNVERKNFAGMMSALDDGVGQVINALFQNNMYNNSIILFTTDNGGPANGFDGNAANNFPLRGVKYTLWEGGVRGTGFVHSPLFKNQSYVSQHMLHVSDWLPTLFSAAGGNPGDLGNIDGIDMWQTLSTNGKPKRNEILHNIRDGGKTGAIRVGDYKLLTGKIHMTWDGWYPPYQLPTDSVDLHYTNQHLKTQNFKDTRRKNTFFERRKLEKTLSDVNSLKFVTNYEMNEINLKAKHPELQVVQCGIKPMNASTNCKPDKAPCLYHIPSDPCEYYNIADSNPDIVNTLLTRFQDYVKTMVPPGNKPFDDRGNPIHNGGAWKPWL